MSTTEHIEVVQREIRQRCKRERRRPDVVEGCCLRVRPEDRSVDPLAERAAWREWLDRENLIGASEECSYASLAEAMHINLVATRGQIAATSPTLPAWW